MRKNIFKKMGCLNNSKIAISIILLMITAVGFHVKDINISSDINLNQSLGLLFTSWTVEESVPLSSSILQGLNLDDYYYKVLQKKEKKVSLYIGYYRNQNKVGFAHSPLVCFPGQGWLLTERNDILIEVDSDVLETASMVITKGEQKQVILYWFQSYDKTSAGTFKQKLNLLISKFKFSRSNNAFVRIMVPLSDKMTIEDAQLVSVEFIKEFYPVFKKIMTSE